MNALIQYITKYFHSMYYVTIAVLLVVAIVESTARGFPVNLAVAVFTASVLDIAIKRLWLKRTPIIPLSAIITGLIIGSVSVNAPVLGVFIATVLAILSKFVIRLKGSHIFNPAVFGVVISQLFNPAAHSAAGNAVAQGAAQAAEGFGPGGFAVSIVLVPLLLFANYKTKKLWTSIPFLIASALLFYFTGLTRLNSLNIQDIFKFFEVLPWYFAFIIVSEPKTSPYAKNEQIVFGIGIAILSVLATLLSGSHTGGLVAILLGNLMYAVYRVSTRGYNHAGNIKSKKTKLMIGGIVIVLVSLYFGVSWLIDLVPNHVPMSHGLK